MPVPVPAVGSTIEAARRWCAGQRISLLDLHESLDRVLPSLVPDGHQLTTCGCCGRSAVVPLGSMLADLRRAHGFTPEDVAERAGRSRILVIDVEKGRRNPTAPVIAAYEELVREAQERAAEIGS